MEGVNFDETWGDDCDQSLEVWSYVDGTLGIKCDANVEGDDLEKLDAFIAALQAARAWLVNGGSE